LEAPQDPGPKTPDRTRGPRPVRQLDSPSCLAGTCFSRHLFRGALRGRADGGGVSGWDVRARIPEVDVGDFGWVGAGKHREDDERPPERGAERGRGRTGVYREAAMTP